MQFRRLGRSDLDISAIGIGTWAIGGDGWSHGWGPQHARDSIDAIHRALDAGLTWIDTAPVYGLGHAEGIVARALTGRRDRPYVFTKCGYVWDARGTLALNLDPQSIRQECEDSLRRLNVDAIDLYQIHRVEPTARLDDAWHEMHALQREGKVRWIGLSNVTPAQMTAAQAIAPVTSVQMPYSLVDRQIESEILPLASRAGMGVLAYSPMQCGLLSGAMTRARLEALAADDHRRRRDEFREPLLSRVFELVDELRALGGAYGFTPGEMAIAWTLRHAAVAGAVVGIRHPSQVAGIARAADVRFDPDDLRLLDSRDVLQSA